MAERVERRSLSLDWSQMIAANNEKRADAENLLPNSYEFTSVPDNTGEAQEYHARVAHWGC
ncbi:hypothetical protein DBV39_05710 [Orrella marina]|uniref:Uncharacterized protein n=1 Tax=Orrella marina TaxID=2163011 RepID=A0A2R4XHI1_9BURK|nr:hypothetical protein DBV39_05710 [Orrella marina]